MIPRPHLIRRGQLRLTAALLCSAFVPSLPADPPAPYPYAQAADTLAATYFAQYGTTDPSHLDDFLMSAGLDPRAGGGLSRAVRDRVQALAAIARTETSMPRFGSAAFKALYVAAIGQEPTPGLTAPAPLPPAPAPAPSPVPAPTTTPGLNDALAIVADDGGQSSSIEIDVTKTPTPFRDAVALVMATPGVTRQATAFAVLNKYGLTTETYKKWPLLRDCSDYLGKTYTKPVSFKSDGMATSSRLFGLFNFESAAASTFQIDALATFLADRAKQTGAVVFFSDLQYALATDTSKADCKKDPRNSRLRPLPLVKDILPRTCDVLYEQTITGDASYIQAIQSAVKGDVAALPNNLDAIPDDIRVTVNGQTYALTPSEMAMVKVSIAVVRGIAASHSPPVIIDELEKAGHGLAIDFSTDPAQPKKEYLFRDLAILSHIIADGNGGWITRKEIAKYIDTPDLELGLTTDTQVADIIRLTFGLSYKLDRQLYGSGGVASYVATFDTEHVDKAWKLVSNLAAQGETLVTDTADLLNQIKQKNNGAAKAGPIAADFARVSHDWVTFLGFLQSNGFISNFPANIGMTNVLPIIVSGESLVADAHSGDYVAAVHDLVEISQLVSSLPEFATEAPEISKVVAKVTKGATVFASMAAAKNKDELSTALNNAALPVGSYLTKQDAGFSVYLNGFVGVATGPERLRGDLTGTTAKRNSWHGAVTAPVGLAFTYGIKDEKGIPASILNAVDVGTFSVFVPVVDLGAVTSLRFGHAGGTLPPVTWSNVFAPGGYLVFGLKDLPISVFAGTQYGPALRKISLTNGATIERSAWQAPNFGISVDIPLFTLFGGRPKSGDK